MFGQNAITKVDHTTYQELAVEEIFYTLQGEGPDSGKPAVFIRLSGCNLACTFCFVGSTNIVMGDGTRKKIREVRAGEQVLAYDEASGKFKPRTVLRTMKSSAPSLLSLSFSASKNSNNPADRLVCTHEHPLLVRGRGWVAAKDLVPGDVVLHFSTAERMRMFNAYRPSEHTPERRAKLSASFKKTWATNPTLRAGVLGRMRSNNPMKDPAVALKSHRARKDLNKLSSAETVFLRAVEGLPVEFNKDAALALDNLVPDFVVPGQNKVIEVWAASALHAQIRGRRWREARRARFAKAGYDVLFVPMPDSGVRNGAYAAIRKQVAEFIHNGEVFHSAKEILPGSKSWTQFAGSSQGDVLVYNLEVEDLHTYVANGKIVHNCDTQFENGLKRPRMDVAEIVARVNDAVPDGARHPMVVITGGEPLRQDISELVRLLWLCEYDVQVETAGTCWPERLTEILESDAPYTRVLKIVCSPKTPRINARVAELCMHYKYVAAADELSAEDGLPCYSTQTPGTLAILYRPTQPGIAVWLSPLDAHNEEQTKRNMKAAAASCLKHGYRLSLQVHKIVDLP